MKLQDYPNLTLKLDPAAGYAVVVLTEVGDEQDFLTADVHAAIDFCAEHYAKKGFIVGHIFDPFGEEIFQITGDEVIFVLDERIKPLLLERFATAVREYQG